MKNNYLTSYRNQVTGLLLAMILFSCNAPTDNTSVKLPDNVPQSTTRVEQPSEQPAVSEIQQPAPVQHNRSHLIKATASKDSDQLNHVKYEISTKTIDSLNKIISLYDTSQYNQLAVSYFTTLSEGLHGKPFFANNPDSLLNSIIEILSTRINDGTDIVFLIDKTGSMDDDIEKVQKSMVLILDYLKKFNNVKVGIAEYGDKNWHYDLWYNRLDLSYDIEGMKNFLKDFKTIGNPDVPESVNDAIVKTVSEMNWTEGNKRLMLVIGDAPSQLPPRSDYTLQQVIDKCDSMKVTFNLYPIIIGVSPMQKIDNFVRKDFSKTYPNPVDQTLNVELDQDGLFNYIINDISGKVVKQGIINSRNSSIAFNDLEDGNYLIQIFDQTASKFNSKLIVVRHN